MKVQIPQIKKKKIQYDYCKHCSCIHDKVGECMDAKELKAGRR